MLPDSLKIVTNTVDFPDGATYKVTRFDPEDRVTRDYSLSGYEVTVVADTENSSDNRLTTLVCKFPRVVLAEFNTHRVFSRNSASSRARSLETVLRDVVTNPYVPIFTRNQRGMSGNIVETLAQRTATLWWLDERDAAVRAVVSAMLGQEVPESMFTYKNTCCNNGDYPNAELLLQSLEVLLDKFKHKAKTDRYNVPGAMNLHKQVLNRLLEPFMMHEVVVTASDWDNFFKLRDHEAADPAIHAIAVLMKAAINESSPVENDFHLPFVNGEEVNVENVMDMAFESAGRAAQISYKPVNTESKISSVELGKRLLADGHMSPFEHAAFDSNWFRDFKGVDVDKSNFDESWVQFRKYIENKS